LERLRAAQIERGGEREAVAAAVDQAAIAARLGASRDQVSAEWAGLLRAVASFTRAGEAHNQALAAERDQLAGAGLLVRDDLCAPEEEHAEGALDALDGGGVRAAGTDWLPVPVPGFVMYALRQVFAGHGPGHPLAEIGKYGWRSWQVEDRTDGLKAPVLKDPLPVPPRPAQPSVMSVRDLLRRPA
jgi:hypothetical protein